MNRYEPRMRELDAEPLGYEGMFANDTFPIHLTEAQIQEAERQLGARFPDDYRNFIRDFGGFSMYEVFFPVQSEIIQESEISAFLGIVSKGGYDVWDIVRSYLSACKYSEGWREEWLHLGTTGRSSIALAFKGSEVGSVYAFDFDDEPHLVAQSFGEFMNLLYRNSEDTLPKKSSFWDSFSTP